MIQKLRSFERAVLHPQTMRRRIRAPHSLYTYLHLSVSVSLSHIPNKLSPSLSSLLTHKLSIMCARWKGRQFYSRIQNRPLIGALQFNTSVLVASPYLSASFDVTMTRQMATADKLVQIASTRGHYCSNDGAMTVQNLQRHRR